MDNKKAVIFIKNYYQIEIKNLKNVPRTVILKQAEQFFI